MDLTSIKDAATDEYFKQPVVVSCSTQCVCVCVCVLCVLRSVCNILLRMAYNTVYIESMEHATCINEIRSSGIFSSSRT